MAGDGNSTSPEALPRRLTLLQAVALNMSNMVGSGPFITIPLILMAMGGPQAMIGWAAGLVLAWCDGLVWSELSAAMPSSGGTFRYLKEAFGKTGAGASFGRVMAFLFIWQFLVSGPAEIASGAIGFRQYLGYFHFGAPWFWKALPPAVCLLSTVLLYRRIESIGRVAVVMWAGMMITILAIIVLGLLNFNSANLTLPPHALDMNRAFFRGLGAAMLIAMYDYLGYYDVCYVAEEVRDPGRNLPRSILISVGVVALLYFLLNLSLIAVVPWREAMRSESVASLFMERVAGRGAATVITVLILWTALASVLALLLGASRILFAAARDGLFFRIFARLHPRGKFPHLALAVVGVFSAVASFFTLEEVINVLVVVRVAVQFIGQIVALFFLHARRRVPLPFRMWFYPLPALAAMAGWLYIFVTAPFSYIKVSFLVLAAGLIAYAIWWSATGKRLSEG